MNIEPNTGGSPSGRKRSRLGRLARLTMLALPLTIVLSAATPAWALSPVPSHTSGGATAGSHVLYAYAPVTAVTANPGNLETLSWWPQLQYYTTTGWKNISWNPTLFQYNGNSGAYEAMPTSYGNAAITMTVGNFGFVPSPDYSCWHVGGASLGTCIRPPVYAFSNLPAGYTFQVVESYVWDIFGQVMTPTHYHSMLINGVATSWSFKP